MLRSTFHVFLLLMAAMASAHAACTTPAGNAGDVIYNATHNVMQYCNGTVWRNTGNAVQSAAGTACTGPVAPEGSVLYNSPTGVIQFCNGDNWINTACPTYRTPGGPGCTGPTGAAGTMLYETTSNELQFCDSTNWVAMGWPCGAAGLTNWSQHQKLYARYSTSSGDNFGRSVSLSGSTLAIGQPGYNAQGAVNIYTISGSSWVDRTKFTSPGQGDIDVTDIANNDSFGHSVALENTTLAVGAYGDDDKGSASGSVFIFTGSGTSWTQQAKVTASDGAASDNLGRSVSLSSNTIVTGTHNKNSFTGAAYVFTRSGSTWSQQAKLTASDGAASDQFGFFVAIDSNTIIVGAFGDDDYGSGSGAAYIYTRSGSSWTQQAKITPADGAANDAFGRAVAISSNTVVIGAYGDADAGASTGSAYVFTRSGSTWSQQAKLLASVPTAGENFGASVTIKGDTIVVGGTGNNGSAYVYTRSGTNWTLQSKLIPADAPLNGRFGSDVATDGSTAIISADNDPANGSSSGSAYVFRQ